MHEMAEYRDLLAPPLCQFLRSDKASGEMEFKFKGRQRKLFTGEYQNLGS